MRKPFDRDDLSAFARMIQLSDSALPVGAFSFSAALETAAAEGIVTDAYTLRQYVRAVVMQSLTTDVVASLVAFRAAAVGDYAGLLNADRHVLMFRMGTEGRRMVCRIGFRTAELAALLTDSVTVRRWNSDIRSGRTPGTHSVSLAVLFCAAELSEHMLFASCVYGVAGMVVGAALRCVRVSHYDTQRILFEVVSEAMGRYREVASMSLSDMNSFTPELDILASLHEVGCHRMFMS